MNDYNFVDNTSPYTSFRVPMLYETSLHCIVKNNIWANNLGRLTSDKYCNQSIDGIKERGFFAALRIKLVVEWMEWI